MYDGERFNAAILQPVKTPNARPWLDQIDKPDWMSEESSLYGNSWTLIDKNPTNGPREINWEYPLYDPITDSVSLLTDPENEASLELAQKYCIKLRDGNITDIDSMEVQYQSTTTILNFLAWMRLNLINSLDELKPIHLRKYMSYAPFGWAYLLEVDERLERYVKFLKQTGGKMPTKGRYERVDAFKAYLEMGLNTQSNNALGKDFVTKFWRAALELNGEKQISKDSLDKAQRELTMEPAIASIGGMKRHPAMWQSLHDMSPVLPQKLYVNASEDYVPGETMRVQHIAREVLKRADIEIVEGMTETIPDLQGFHLIDRAIRWVLMYSEDLIRLRRAANKLLRGRNKKKSQSTISVDKKILLKKLIDDFNISFSPSDPGAPWPVDPVKGKSGKSKKLSLSDVTGQLLMAACAIVIEAFTARRREEVHGIRGGEPTEDDCAPRAIYIDESEEPWLWCWIEKTLQKWDRIPIPRVVVKAVEVLEELTKETRMKTKKRNLFELLMLDSDKVTGFDIVKYINDFADFVDVPLLEDGSKWIFKPHQFRRLFSLLFMYRYKYGEHGKFEALSWHLRHFNMEMTKRYIEEIEESDMLKAHRKQMVTDLMSQVLKGQRNASGPAGDDLKQQLDKAIKEVIKNTKILGGNERPEIARKIAETVMDKLEIEMVPFLWCYCVAYKNIEGEGFHGNCIKEGSTATGPDLARATPKRCHGCQHLYVDDHFRPYWETGSKQNQEFIESDKMSEPLKEIARENLRIFNGGLEQYFDHPVGEIQA